MTLFIVIHLCLSHSSPVMQIERNISSYFFQVQPSLNPHFGRLQTQIELNVLQKPSSLEAPLHNAEFTSSPMSSYTNR